MSEPALKENENSVGIQPPQGYVLVEAKMYEKLLELAYGGPSSKKNSSPVYLRVLKPYHLGDIKTQINPGEIIDWVPRESITIRGDRNTVLGSFLNLWNKQDPRSSRFDADFDPVFEVQNVEVLESYLGPFTSSVRVSNKSKISEEEERIKSEELRGDAATTDSNAGVANLKVKTTSKKDTINKMSPERMVVSNKKVHGIEDVESPNDFQLTTKVQDHRVVASIPGPSAEAQEISAKETDMKKSRRR